MKIRLLTGGGFYFLDHINFPVEVEGTVVTTRGLGQCASVSSDELKRIGAKFDWNYEGCDMWSFVLGSECEVLSDV